MKVGGQIPWNVTPICETSQIYYLMGRRPMKDVLGHHIMDLLFHLVHWLSIILLLRKTSQESINLERKSYLDCSLDTLCTRGEFGRVTYWLQTLRSWRRWAHRNLTQKRLNAKEVTFPKRGEFIFPIADGRIKTPGGDQKLRTSTLIRHRPIQGESNIDFLGESEGSLPPPQDSFPDADEAINDFWSMSGNFIYRHHVEPRVNLYSPRKESFPSPLKHWCIQNYSYEFGCQAGETHQWFLEYRWIKRFVWYLDRFHSVYSMKWETSRNLFAPVRGWQNGKRHPRQIILWPEIWMKLGRKEKHKWALEEPKLDNARRLLWIYFIDPEDKKFKDIIKNARWKLETPVAPAMPCKTCKKSTNGETRSKTDFKSKIACILEASESTRLRMEEWWSKNIENSQIGMSWPKSWSSMEDPVVPLERNLYGHPLAGLLWEKQFEKILLKHGWEKVSNVGMLIRTSWKRIFLICVCGRHHIGWKENINPIWKVLNKEVDLEEPTSFLDHVYLGCTQRQSEISKDTVDNYRAVFESRISAGRADKLPFPQNLRISSWSYDMAGHAKQCVERYCELANKTTRQLYKVSTPCIDDHHFKEEETKSVGELSNTCSQIVLKCYTWQELDDLIFYGQWISLHDQ